jgi:hypothetical protein
MATILRAAGLRVHVGRYSIRIEDCGRFVFQQYGGDLGDPVIDAAADTVSDMLRDGQMVSDALSRSGIRHRFEIYDDGDSLVGYFHHLCPLINEGIPADPSRGA